jgi:hypothetical protein
MALPDPVRPRRPIGVTVLCAVLLLAGLAILSWSMRAAFRAGSGLLAPGVLPVFLAAGVLPGIWALATAVGMFLGRNWARASFYAMAVLTVVLAAGTLSRPLDSAGAKLAAGSWMSMFILAGLGVWYLRGTKADDWFR